MNQSQADLPDSIYLTSNSLLLLVTQTVRLENRGEPSRNIELVALKNILQQNF